MSVINPAGIVNGPKRFLIADDDATARRGLRELLVEGYPGSKVGEEDKVGEAVRRVTEGTWDLLVLEIAMRGGEGLKVLSQMRKMGCAVPVLVVSRHAAKEAGECAFKAGAKGFVCKDEAPAEMMAAVKVVLAGRIFVKPSMVEGMMDRIRGTGSTDPLELLSPRELEYLGWMAKGKTPTEIGKVLGLSIKTVSTYQLRAMQKLGFQTKFELMRFALEHGLDR